MPTKTYTKPRPKKTPPVGARYQAQSSAKGKLHRDTFTYYRRSEPAVDLFKQQLKIIARVAGKELDLSGLMSQLTWTDDSAASQTSSSVIQYLNTQVPLTGTLQLNKPSLSQYKQLVSPLLSASVGQSRYGATGVVIILMVGYGRSYVPVWAQRVQPTQGISAEEIDIVDGTWSLNLTDDLTTLNQSVDDFKFTKGKRTRTRGWKCHEIAAAVARQYSIPIKQLAQGTAYMSLGSMDTTSVSPLSVITAAYDQEQFATGRAFIVRWGVPDAKHPMGGLEVVPMRRNPNLLRFRDQLTNAVLTRSSSPDFATSILGRATIKEAHGRHKKITYHYVNEQAVRRFGFIHKIVDFNNIGSAQELQILVKRAMAVRLTPLRTAELTHPGVATIRRGDAIKIDIPEEGYGDLSLDAYGKPAVPKSKQTAAALRAAVKNDPLLFGGASASALDPTSSANITSATANDQTVLLPVADQNIAFVTSVQHSASAGSYTMDIQTTFVDTLDPDLLKAEMDANIRSGKQLAKAAASQGTSFASATGWVRVGATLDPTRGQWPTYDDHGGFSFAELLQAGANMGMQPSLTKVLKAQASSRGTSARPEMAMETALWVRMPGSTKQFRIWKNDVGSGQRGQPHFKVDLHQGIASALGWKPNQDIEVKLA